MVVLGKVAVVVVHGDSRSNSGSSSGGGGSTCFGCVILSLICFIFEF